jgi:pyochelin synthetase
MTSAAQPGLEPIGMEAMTGAWNRVFRRTGIGANENFFELGGDTWSAAELFAEISNALGRQISPVWILHAPTIASLHRVLQRPAPLFLPAITPLKKGDSKVPSILLFHGCGGTVLDFVKLANSIQVPNSIYGLQNPGTDGFAKPLERIEDVADYHLKIMKEQKIAGPYFLIGHSAGGLIALEVANRLKDIGEAVPLIVMMDSFLPLGALPLYRIAGVKLRRQVHRITIALKTSMPTSAKRGVSATNERERMSLSKNVLMRRFQEAENRALDAYRGRPYSGPVKFIRARDRWTFPLDPNEVWSSFVTELCVETAPGDHVSMLSEHHKSLGSILSRYIQDAVAV